MSRAVLVTGAGGYLGSRLVASLADDPGELATIVAADIRAPDTPLPGITHIELDVRDPALGDVLQEHRIDTVVHLAAVVSPGRKPDRDLEHSIDVGGTRNVLESCLAARVKKVIITSSGAAYGYHADNPKWLDEDDPLRGNPEFAYADHKRQVEEMLAAWRQDHPELAQLVLRPGTILGAGTRNQITDLFDRRFVLGIRNAATPFVFIWDEDMVQILRRGISSDVTGVYNVAGDGAVPLRDLAARMGKPLVAVPAGFVRGVLRLLRLLRLTQYGPEQVDFLRYRPVFANRRLKQEFGYTPQKTSAEVFEVFWKARRAKA